MQIAQIPTMTSATMKPNADPAATNKTVMDRNSSSSLGSAVLDCEGVSVGVVVFRQGETESEFSSLEHTGRTVSVRFATSSEGHCLTHAVMIGTRSSAGS